MEKTKRGKGDPEDMDKTQVLQEARQRFMANNVAPKKLVDTLTKCIFIHLQGEKLDNKEASDLFLQITQLFQYKDRDSSTNTLRRLIYIGIKALSQQADNAFVVTSSLTNDVTTSSDPAIKASALRALCQISDASNYPTIERYLKQGVVDKHPVVASAALTSLIRIGQVNSEIVKRCTNEIQEALNSDSPMVQYHALGLRYNSCKNDRLAISRLISNCSQQGLRSPLATCLLIKIITKFINDNNVEEVRVYKDYIRNQLNHRSEMVEYEAANALVLLGANASESDRKSAVIHLESFLTSSKAALRFAAVRSLNKLAATSPKDVSVCNFKLEALISQSDCNRSIAILAITTLLKTGDESSVEKFLKKIGEFLSEIDDGFKVIVIGSVRQLCQKYPRQHPAMMDFLSDMLREEGGYSYKKAIVDTIIKMIEDNEETKEKGLRQLCEFIEDCEHISLAVEVLNLLGREGPKTKKASSYIRFIANRLLLDAPPVACAATSALAKFGVVPELRETIRTVLERFSLHEDYEVMERAVFYKNILDLDDPSLNNKFITISGPKYNFADMESQLIRYLQGDCTKPFSMSCVALADSQNNGQYPLDGPIRDEDIDDIATARSDEKPTVKPSGGSPRPPLDIFDELDIQLGDIVKSTPPLALTNSEISEFWVQCIKHIYENHIVFQFDVTNTVNTLYLEKVNIEMCAPMGFRILAGTECPKLAFQETAHIYLCVRLEDDFLDNEVEFTNVVLGYKYRTVDPETSEPSSDDDRDLGEDEFPLDENIPIYLSDFTL